MEHVTQLYFWPPAEFFGCQLSINILLYHEVKENVLSFNSTVVPSDGFFESKPVLLADPDFFQAWPCISKFHHNIMSD